MLPTLFSLPVNLFLEDLCIEDHLLALVLGSALEEVPCPGCGQISHRIHSRYMRTLADLPSQGRAVKLQIQVRRFFCDAPACCRKTFAEQFPLLAPAYARRTSRQAESLGAIASALGGRAGTRLVKRLSMPTSRFTLLRLIRQTSTPPRSTPRVLGVDDFAWKKGDRYGTILVDLEAHRVVDVLPDREAETFVVWLKAHPGVQIISRDRAGNYADGARRGAPEAIQVADRFHLFLNLTTALQKMFERQQDRLHQVAAQKKTMQMSEPAGAVDPPTPEIKPPTATEAQRQGRRAQRKSRYDEVLKLHRQGANQVTIAALTGLHRETIRRYLNAPDFPEIVRPGKRSQLDPYKAYLQERLAAGQRNVQQLVSELREQGYQQGETIVYEYVRRMREQPQWQQAVRDAKKRSHLASEQPPSAREAAWLFVCHPRKLRFPQAVKLDDVRRLDENLEKAYQLAQDFRVMITAQQEYVLNRWLTEAQGSGIAELRSFATGILRDFDAVRAALTLSYSNDHVA